MKEPYGLSEFVSEARAAIAKRMTATETLGVLTPGFKRLLANRFFLRERLKADAVVGDELCLHKDRDFAFVVLARGVSSRAEAQGSSHAVMPHDHGPLWALYGIYEGKSRFQRYEPEPGSQTGDFPGLRLIRETAAQAGDCDAIEPHNMHLPVSDPTTGSVIIVVYDRPLETVVRRGYVRALKGVVDFQGIFPPTPVSTLQSG